MKEYHVVGNQRVTGDFKLYVMFNIDEYDGRETVVTPADLCWEVIDEYDDMVVAAAPPVDVCWTYTE